MGKVDEAISADACFRCGYDLRGIADDSPCPECGLLAGRSRMPSDELRHARPRWLRTLGVGTWLTLAAWAGVPAAAWLLTIQLHGIRQNYLSYFSIPAGTGSAAIELQLLPLPFTLAAAGLAAGTWLLTAAEGRADADQATRGRRRVLRLMGLVPLALTLEVHAMLLGSPRMFWDAFNSPLTVMAGFALTLPLPLMAFLRLRGLAKRVPNPSLAEHCAIVGVGASAALLAPALVITAGAVIEEPVGSVAFLVVALATGVGAILFYLWAGFVLLRFALAFRRAGRAAKRAWADADVAATM